MNIRRIIVYALFIALFPMIVFFLVGFFVPLANSGLLDAYIESEEGGEEHLYELQERIALGLRIARVAVSLALAVVFARLVFVQRTKLVLHLLSVVLLGWLLGVVGAVFLCELRRALTEAPSDEMPIWLWHVVLRDLGITAASALVGGLAGYFLLRRQTNHA